MTKIHVALMMAMTAGSAAPVAAQTMCSPNALFAVGNKMGMAVADIYRSPADNARPSYLREARSKLMSVKTSLKRAGITNQDAAIDGAMKSIDSFSAKVGPSNLITLDSAGRLGKDVERALGAVRTAIGRTCPK